MSNTATGGERQTHEEWQKDLENIDLEIARLAVMCQVRLLDPGIIEHVLDDQESVCGNNHTIAFKSLRGLLFLHYDLQKKLVEAFGEVETAEIIIKVREHLAPRIGNQLGSLK
jgi:hypothetical protein